MRDWLVNLPEELTESDLVDMVEGTLPAAREGVAIAALKAEPRLGLLIKQLRVDKAGLAGLGAGLGAGAGAEATGVSANGVSTDLVARVVESCRVKTLRELAAEAEASVTDIPVSSLQIDEAGPLRAVWGSVLFRFSAAAAVLALVGVVVYSITTDIQQERGGIAVAQRDSVGWDSAGRNLAELAQPLPAGVDENAGPVTGGDNGADSTAIASGADATTPTGEGSHDVVTDPGTSTAMSTGVTAGAEPTKPDVGDARGMSPATAAKLAREGMLGVVVTTTRSAATIQRFDALVRLAPATAIGVGDDPVWRSVPVGAGGETGQAFAALMRVRVDEAIANPGKAGGRDGATPTVVAGDDAQGDAQGDSGGAAQSGAGRNGPGNGPGNGLGDGLIAGLPPIGVRSAYSAEVAPSERGIEALCRSIREDGVARGALRAGEDVTIEFRRLDAPASGAATLDPSSIMWWTLPSSRWEKPALVPVVVHGRP
jgi:hypothetical protein